MTDQLREAKIAFTNAVNARSRSGVTHALSVPHHRDVEAIWEAIKPFLANTLDVDRLHRAILDELAELWGEPSDGISAQIRPIVARNIIDRYARLRGGHQ